MIFCNLQILYFKSKIHIENGYPLKKNCVVFPIVERTLVRVCLHWCESESEGNITLRWVHRESNLMFTLSSEKDQRQIFAFVFACAQSKWSLSQHSVTFAGPSLGRIALVTLARVAEQMVLTRRQEVTVVQRGVCAFVLIYVHIQNIILHLSVLMSFLPKTTKVSLGVI